MMLPLLPQKTGVTCRIGSLEIMETHRMIITSVTCRIGSLEM